MNQYSLSEFLAAVQMSVADSFPETYWVRAELSSLSVKQGGHCYMEFVESGAKNAYGQETFSAKIRANCWRNRWAVLSAYFEETTGQPLRVGMQILAEVRVEFHPVYGMSLLVENLDPKFTLGDLARQKQETLRRLEEEGVIDMQQSLTLATLPKRVAVISSASAAGYQDFVHQLTNNSFGFGFQVALFESLMQGDKAADSICFALQKIAQQEASFDVVVIIRGGGASTDLSCFDQYDLAFHCANFPLPILSGIGHTRDVSVLDRVAFAAVKTPTAAAEYLIEKMNEQLRRLDELLTRLADTANLQIQRRRLIIDRLEMQIQMTIKQRIDRQNNQLNLIERTIALQSPERIFRMGYSLTTCNGQIVRRADEVHAGDVITTIFADGQVNSTVER